MRQLQNSVISRPRVQMCAAQLQNSVISRARVQMCAAVTEFSDI